MEEITMKDMVNISKQYGFIYQGSEIYGGLANTWDYGPLGSVLKDNIKSTWKKRFVQERENAYLVDPAILMHPKVWEASGHTSSFTDPKMDCKECKTRQRADVLIEAHCHGEVNPDTMTNEEMEAYIEEHKINCPVCGKHNWTNIRQFNMMFETSRGVTEDSQNKIYLRPETAQGEYVNFPSIQRTMRAKIPFGIAQIGKAFRNEITPGNFIFRTIEFEQMEHQYFCKADDSMRFYDEFKQKAWNFLVNDIGINKDKLRFKDHDKLAHYAKSACDIQYLFPIGWNELNGIHNRTNYDLSRHAEFSGKSMEYTDPYTNEKYIPSVIEYSIGADRLMLAVLCDAYDEEQVGDETRVVLRLHPNVSAYKIAVLPLQKNLSDKAKEIYDKLSEKIMCTYDESGSIGKRYRRQDEIGTPFCVTIDFDTLEKGTATVRDRDTMEQVTIPADQILEYVNKRM